MHEASCYLSKVNRGHRVSNIATNKSELVDIISEQVEVPKTTALKFINAFIENVTTTLRSGESITFPGFGSFSVKPRAARTGRNPKTGEPLQIPAAIIPSFKAGKGLKDAVNSGSVVREESV